MDYLIDKILDVVFWIVEGVIGLLPTYEPPNTGMLQTMFNALATFNQYFPVVELAECVVAYLAFCVIYMIVRPIMKFGRVA